jgi:hypothetical protein
MTVINRQFYQSWRGPGPTDQDSWSLVFDEETRRRWCATNGGPPGMPGSTSWRYQNF